MPEGPEVKCVAEALRGQTKGLYIDKLFITEKGAKFCNVGKLPYGPVKINDVISRGKKVVFVLSQGFIITSLAMEGRWQWEEEGNNIRLYFRLAHKKGRVYLYEKMLYYHDTRFGSVDFCDDLSSLDDLGPDLLEEKLDRKTFQARFAKAGKRKIGATLLEQNIVAGIGNYLRAEILYLAGIDPFRKCETLTEKEWASLHKYTYQVINESYRCNGLTIRSYISPDGKKGTYQPLVYGLKEDNDGDEIVKDVLPAGRSMYWCPAKQK